MHPQVARTVSSLFNKMGVEVRRYRPRPTMLTDIDAAAADIIRRVQVRTKTSQERLFGLVEAVRYVTGNGIPGDVVECGVWRGGSMMAAAHALLACGDRDRGLHLFDTYEGMPPPGQRDVSLGGYAAAGLMADGDPDDPASIWCKASLEDVREGMTSTGYPSERVHYVKGLVQETIPAGAPERIALLRLDTDWYESTRHEMTHLYPRLVPGGVLIVDDYGHWQGCRAAVDEYFREAGERPLLCRLDYTGRIAIKPSGPPPAGSPRA